MARVVRHTDVVLLPTEQGTLCFTLCMDRLVRSEQVPTRLKHTTAAGLYKRTRHQPVDFCPSGLAI